MNFLRKDPEVVSMAMTELSREQAREKALQKLNKQFLVKGNKEPEEIKIKPEVPEEIETEVDDEDENLVEETDEETISDETEVPEEIGQPKKRIRKKKLGP